MRWSTRARARRRCGWPLALLVAGAMAVTAACSDDDTSGTAAAAHDEHGEGAVGELSADDRAAVMRATAAFQDVEAAEAAGYVSTLDALGCFHDTDLGGMGLHFLDESLLDDELDPLRPEALVYELDAAGEVVGLVGLEYIVPVDAWSAEEPPSVLGLDLHQHPTLPLWVLHSWVWKDNPAGMFEDFNPAVRPCPANVPLFGVDLP